MTSKADDRMRTDPHLAGFWRSAPLPPSDTTQVTSSEQRARDGWAYAARLAYGWNLLAKAEQGVAR